MPPGPYRGSLSVIYRVILLALLGTVIGVVVSLLAIAFVECVGWLNDILLVSPRTRIQFEESPGLVAAATVLVPAIGGLLVGLIIHRTWCRRSGRLVRPIRSSWFRRAAPRRRRAAACSRRWPPSSRSDRAPRSASMAPWSTWARWSAPRSIACAWESPTFRRSRSRAASPPAIATAFNAPIAGLVFAHEVILRHYSMQAFAPTAVASAAGYVVANVIFERPPLFLVSFEGVRHGHEFILFAVVGVLSALLAMIYMKAILGCAALAARSRIPRRPCVRWSPGWPRRWSRSSCPTCSGSAKRPCASRRSTAPSRSAS